MNLASSMIPTVRKWLRVSDVSLAVKIRKVKLTHCLDSWVSRNTTPSAWEESCEHHHFRILQCTFIQRRNMGCSSWRTPCCTNTCNYAISLPVHNLGIHELSRCYVCRTLDTPARYKLMHRGRAAHHCALFFYMHGRVCTNSHFFEHVCAFGSGTSETLHGSVLMNLAL